MNIDWAIPCRYAEVHDNLATVVGAGIDTYWVAELPSQLQILIAVRLLATTDELEEGGPHEMTHRVRDPHGDLLGELSATLTFEGEAARPEWLTGITVPVAVTFEAAEEGTYTLELAVGASSEAFPIHVVVGSP